MKIDLHAHLIPEDTVNKAGGYGPRLDVNADGTVTLGWNGKTFRILDPRQNAELAQCGKTRTPVWAVSDPTARLREMDAKGIDAMAVTISPLLFLYSGDPAIAVPWSSTQNDALAKYCSGAPERLFFMATVPLQDIDAAVREAERTVGELGAKAINIGASNIAGRRLDDEYFYPLWEKCQQLDVFVAVHPEPTNVIQGAADQSLAEQLLDYCYQDTIAPLTLMVGGVFDEFPRLNVYCTHGGGFFPFQFGRLEIHTANLAKPSEKNQFFTPVRMKKKLRDYLPNLYLDVLVHDVAARHMIVDLLGVDNVVVGDNFDGGDSADGFKFVDEMNLSAADKAKIMGGNAKRLLKL
ncbi:UNVERIFIED_CONTAM: amidohydrolase [Mycobacterium avium subsp. hominissuis]